MKLPIISCVLAALMTIPLPAHAITTDPALTAAIVAQTEALKSLYNTRTKKQNAILAAETAATAAMTEIHRIENKVLEYLSNAQGAMNNLYQIKRAAELSTKEIPGNLRFVLSSIPSHLRGTAIAAVVSDEMRDAATEAASLYPLIAQLVTSGTYNVSGSEQRKKVNLLDAAERYYIANDIVRRLENINMSLYLLAWQIRTYSLHDLFYHLTPETWANVMGGKAIIDVIIREYSYL